MTKKVKKTQTRKQWIIENVLSLGAALLVVLTIRSSIIEAYKIPSGSMIPTLYIGDRIFVNKFAYGFKIPFSDLVMGRPIYFINREGPKKGDVVVFLYPRDPSIFYIKRVIGTAGDTIEVRNKVLYINQQMAPREPVSAVESKALLANLDDSKYTHSHIEVFQETLGSVTHPIFLDRSSYMPDSYGPVTVPADHLFAMGDNRDFSNDSRSWGFVPLNNVRGKAVIIWASTWIDLFEPSFRIRLDRTGKLVN